MQLRFQQNEPENIRTIPANLIKQAAQRNQSVNLRNAIIQGQLRLTGTTRSQSIALVQCRFEDLVDLSYGNFESNLIFSGSTFSRGINLNRATIASDLRLRNAVFSGQRTRFDDAQILGLLLADRGHFSSSQTTFIQTHFAKFCSFSRAAFATKATFSTASFDAEVIFARTVFRSDALFDAVRFKGAANFEGVNFGATVTFNASKFDSPCSFSSIGEPRKTLTVFAGVVDMVGMSIEGAAQFQGVTFKNKVNLNSARIAGFVNFGPLVVAEKEPLLTTFEDEVDLVSSCIVGNAHFQGVTFSKSSNFSNAQIVGDLRFESPSGHQTTFKGDANFIRASIGGNAAFSGATFEGKVQFGNAQIGGNFYFASLSKPCVLQTSFSGEASFVNVHVTGYADFRGVEFKAKTMFNGADIGRKASFGPVTREKADSLFTRFEDNATFSEWRVNGETNFDQAMFINKGSIEFVRAYFGGAAVFSDIEFNKTVSFSGAVVQGEANFSHSKFSGTAPISLSVLIFISALRSQE